jgi:5-methylcytosine-specific restriction endonuclease McrA
MQAQQPRQPSILQNSVVVFSRNYLPLARINIKRAIVLLITGQAESLDFGNPHIWKVRSPSVVLEVPEHIRLTVSNPERLWKVPPVNRREVLRRDNHSCQYCNSTKNLTIDHVIPRSKGGQHSWDNVVAVPRTKPKAPAHPAVAFAEQFWKAQQDE